MEINLQSWLTILAIVTGPVLALLAQRVLDHFRGQKQRKLVVFKELMATRASRLSPRHVEALNAIEIEFAGSSSKDKAVFDAWRFYLNHLDSHPPDGASEALVDAWRTRAAQLVYDLLFKMSHALGFDHDLVSLEKSVYSPRAFGDLEADQMVIRKSLVAILEGKRPIPVAITNAPGAPSPPPVGGSSPR